MNHFASRKKNLAYEKELIELDVHVAVLNSSGIFVEYNLIKVLPKMSSGINTD